MNQSKYPKSLSILLALNLCALLAMLILTMDDIWDGVRIVMGIQSIVLALGLGLIALPKARGKRRWGATNRRDRGTLPSSDLAL